MGLTMDETLAQLRADSGLTQEEVARHLGITKAAVSKWECGQSMPDIALLPAIAELYAVSIDELFGHRDEPSPEDVNATYLKALELFESDYDSAMEFVREQVRRHWSCAPLLRVMGTALFAQIPSLPGFGGSALSDAALECAQEAERVIKRTMALDPSEESALANLPALSRILMWTGRDEEAEQLIEGHVAKAPNLSALSLAQLYSDSGRADEALVVLQRALLVSLAEAEATVAAMAPRIEGDQLEETAFLALALQPNASYRSIFPTLLPTVRLEQARRAAADQDATTTLRALAQFADALDATCDTMENPQNPPLFDKVTDLMWAEADAEIAAARTEAVAGLRAAYASTLATDPIWNFLCDGDAFQALLARIANQEA